VNLTIDTVWLRLAPSDSNITFLYSCKRNITLSSAVELSGCQPQQQDGNRSYVLRDGGITGAEAYEFECEEVVVAPVLDVHKKAVVPPGNGSFREVLQGGFELNYDTHNHQCDRCEGSGGWCGYQRDETHAGGLTFTCFCESGPTSDRCGTYVFSSPALEFTSLRFSCLIALIFWVMERGVPVVHLCLRAHVFVCLFVLCCNNLWTTLAKEEVQMEKTSLLHVLVSHQNYQLLCSAVRCAALSCCLDRTSVEN